MALLVFQLNELALVEDKEGLATQADEDKRGNRFARVDDRDDVTAAEGGYTVSLIVVMMT